LIDRPQNPLAFAGASPDSDFVTEAGARCRGGW